MNLIKKIQALSSRLHTFHVNNKYNYIGSGTYIFYRSHIINTLRNGVVIGKNCTIGRSQYRCHAGMSFYTTLMNDGKNSHIFIGDNCRINGAYIHAQDFIEIGDNCVIASGINIIDSNGHNVNSENRTAGKDIPKGIKIGNNVWIVVNAIILKDSRIGDNCVVAAGSIVKGVFEPTPIIQGNPAEVVGKVKIL